MPDQGDATSFVGRESDLTLLGSMLEPGSGAPVCFVHGPGGIGKTTLLRELGRRASARGFTVFEVDGRNQEAAQEAAQTALEAMPAANRPLLLLDTYEQVSALGALLRDQLAPCLADGGHVVIAGRQPPEPAWSEDSWAGAVRALPLAPLSLTDSRELARAHGVIDPASIERIATWAAGSPLELAVAADALAAGHELDLARLDAEGMLATTILRRLAGEELRGADRDVIAVAAIARAVDARLLAAVLPGTNGDLAEAWLQGLSFSEPLGTRVTLHERVRAAVRRALSAQDVEREHDLRRRIVDHLYQRAVLGELLLLADIAELVDDPAVRWGMAPATAISHRVDRVAPGDDRKVAELLGAQRADWWPGAQRWLDEAPERVIIIRDAAGDIAGWAITVTPANAPDWAAEDPILGPWLADALSRSPEGDVMLMREGADLTPGRDETQASPVISVGNYAAVVRSGLRSMRHTYAPTDAADRNSQEFLLALGYDRAPELDVEDGERIIHCYVNDWGAGGVVRVFRDIVYRELGLTPPPAEEGTAVAAETVRDALRSFHDPVALAASPLAHGGTADERAAMVRELLRGATGAAFGDSTEERLQRTTIERGYFDNDGGHQRAAFELNLSRTTYFRRLADASARVAEYVLADRT